MANIKINGLALAGSITDNLQLETDIAGATANKVTVLQLKDYICPTPLPINRGGTNSITTLNDDRLIGSSGGKIVETNIETNGTNIDLNAGYAEFGVGTDTTHTALRYNNASSTKPVLKFSSLVAGFASSHGLHLEITEATKGVGFHVESHTAAANEYLTTRSALHSVNRYIGRLSTGTFASGTRELWNEQFDSSTKNLKFQTYKDGVVADVMELGFTSGKMHIDAIKELTSNAGVTIENFKIEDNEIQNTNDAVIDLLNAAADSCLMITNSDATFETTIGINKAAGGAALEIARTENLPLLLSRTESAGGTVEVVLVSNRKASGAIVNGIGSSQRTWIDGSAGIRLASETQTIMTEVTAGSANSTWNMKVLANDVFVDGLTLIGLAGGSTEVNVPGKLTVDTISESTTNAGVTIENFKFEDGSFICPHSAIIDVLRTTSRSSLTITNSDASYEVAIGINRPPTPAGLTIQRTDERPLDLRRVESTGNDVEVVLVSQMTTTATPVDGIGSSHQTWVSGSAGIRLAGLFQTIMTDVTVGVATSSWDTSVLANDSLVIGLEVLGLASGTTQTHICGSLAVDEAVQYGVTVVNTATYDVLPTDHIIHVLYTETGACVITMPTAQLIDGRNLIVKDAFGNAASNNITFKCENDEKIDGLAAGIDIKGNWNSARLYVKSTEMFVV